MKKKDLSEIKGAKPFEKNDIFIYAAVIICLILLFVFLVIVPQSNLTEGFTVHKDGENVCTFTFSDKKLSINDDFSSLIEMCEEDDGLTVIVYTNTDKHSYNKIFFSYSDKSAKVVESNCSSSKDCTFSPSITSQGAIYCAPHKLKVSPIGNSGISIPITG